LNIRTANSEDAKSIARVHVEAWRVAYKGVMPAEFLKSISLDAREKGWVKTLSRDGRGHYVVIEQDGGVAGFCVYGPPKEDLKSKNTGELVALNIAPKTWGKGLGASLIQHVIKEGRSLGWDTIYLWVVRENRRARELYERFGFILEGGEKSEALSPSCVLHELRYFLRLNESG